MFETIVTGGGLLAMAELPGWLVNTYMFLKVLIGFSVIIFVHELGHFLAAKWVGIRVDRFSIGFGTRLFGWRSGEGLTLGNRPDYSAAELREKQYGETDYCFKVLPVGGYVKMLGQDDVIINEETGEMRLSDDPRAFTNRSVSQRMLVVSAGVIFNVLFAALLLMVVFLIGKEVTAPIVGYVPPDSPARGVLLPGDRILEIDGSRIRSFEDLVGRVALSGSDVRLKLERDGTVLADEFVIDTTVIPGVNLPTLNLESATTLELEQDIPPAGDQPALRAGDIITHVAGQPVRNPYEVMDLFQQSRGALLEVTARRPRTEDPTVFDTIICPHRADLKFFPAEIPTDANSASVDNCHLLGLRPRRKVEQVLPGRPAEKAGFKAGDVIVTWGTILNPLYAELSQATQAYANKPMPVTVMRDGREIELHVTPQRSFKLVGEARAEVGVSFSNYGDLQHAVVADVAPGTPFAALNMPRGAEILSLDGRQVRDWYEMAEALQDAAGRTIEVRYRSGPDEITGTVSVPTSIVNALNLTPSAVIWSVNNLKSAPAKSRDGKREGTMALPYNSLALATLLESKIGKTVKVQYSLASNAEIQEAEFEVAAANYDPWQMRIFYHFDLGVFKPLRETIDAGGNPFLAMQMGVDYVLQFVRQMYVFITRLADRSIGTENVAGPVGIITIAVQRAKSGTADLLLFLAFLSVNLAVINFLPMPVMDGGLMLFLLIEKIKGKPLSLKTQMISTMVGLAAIILIGLYVTIQDIGRLF